jgi:hypothetical protein
MTHDKIKAAARRRMARTGESYATARRRVIAERMAQDRGRADAARVGDPVLTADEIRAAAAAHGELGPEYGDAVVASFLERVEEEITVRVDARLAEARQPGASADQGTRRTLLTGIAIGIGIGAFAAVAVGGNPGERMHRLLLVLVALAVICAVSAVYIRRNPVSPRSDGRPRPGVTVFPHQDRRW